MAVVFPVVPNQFFDSNGNPLAGGKVYPFDAGTTTPRTTWSDAAETVPNAHPIILDSAGRATIFWRGNYKITVNSSAGVLQHTIDNVADASVINAARGFGARLTTDITALAAGSALIFATEDFDPGGIYNSATGVMTVPIAGQYLVTFRVLMNNTSGATATERFGIFKNSVLLRIVLAPLITAQSVSLVFSEVLNLAANDTLIVAPVTGTTAIGATNLIDGTGDIGQTTFSARLLP